MGHGDDEGKAHLARPRDATETELMKELICLCGGCKRETLFACKCPYAWTKRERVQQLSGQLSDRASSPQTAATERFPTSAPSV